MTQIKFTFQQFSQPLCDVIMWTVYYIKPNDLTWENTFFFPSNFNILQCSTTSIRHKSCSSSRHNSQALALNATKTLKKNLKSASTCWKNWITHMKSEANFKKISSWTFGHYKERPNLCLWFLELHTPSNYCFLTKTFLRNANNSESITKLK